MACKKATLTLQAPSMGPSPLGCMGSIVPSRLLGFNVKVFLLILSSDLGGNYSLSGGGGCMGLQNRSALPLPKDTRTQITGF